MSSSALSKEAADGFAPASAYDKHRPTYPPVAVEKFLSALHLSHASGVSPNAKILEIGCGTGKFTELIATRLEAFEILAVDPHPKMRKGLEDKVDAQGWKNIKVVEGDAEHLPAEDNWADAALATQAFHWFATEKALEEIHRVLRPGAALGLIWNIEDYNSPKEWECSTAWEQELNDLIWSLEDGVPRFRHLKWREVFDKQLDTTPLQTLKDTFSGNFPTFSLPLGEDEVKWSNTISVDDLWNRYATLSQVAVLKGEKLEEFKGKFYDVLAGAPRNADGEVEINGRTYFAWTSRV